MELQAEIIKSGTWLYAEESPHEVWVARQNFDYYYDEGYEDAPECLNSEGELYQLIFARFGNVLNLGKNFKTLEEAVLAAEATCNGITWDNHRLQKLFHGRQYKLEP